MTKKKSYYCIIQNFLQMIEQQEVQIQPMQSILQPRHLYLGHQMQILDRQHQTEETTIFSVKISNMLQLDSNIM